MNPVQFVVASPCPGPRVARTTSAFAGFQQFLKKGLNAHQSFSFMGQFAGQFNFDDRPSGTFGMRGAGRSSQ